MKCDTTRKYNWWIYKVDPRFFTNLWYATMNIKSQFPLLKNTPDLIYLDNAATTQKPQYVLEQINYFLTHTNANIHRWAYPLALAAEEQWERARSVLAQALNAREDECVFTSNATHSSNLLVSAFDRSDRFPAWSRIVIWIGEHHASIAPWQLLAEKKWLELIYLPLDTETREYDYSVLDMHDVWTISAFVISLASNVTWKIYSLDTVKNLSKKCKNTIIIADASQYFPHYCMDIQLLDVDFAYATGHKIGALTGIGRLRGKKEHLDRLQPWIVGWGAIDTVTTQWHTYQPSPDKFEPWTPNVVGAVSLRAALERIASLSWGNEQWVSFRETLKKGFALWVQHEQVLIEYALQQFARLEKAGLVTIIWPKTLENRLALFSRTIPSWGVHALWRALGEQGICIRTWGHCTYPLHASLNIASTARMSCRFSSSFDDIEQFFEKMELLIKGL